MLLNSAFLFFVTESDCQALSHSGAKKCRMVVDLVRVPNAFLKTANLLCSSLHFEVRNFKAQSRALCVRHVELAVDNVPLWCKTKFSTTRRLLSMAVKRNEVS